MKSFTWAVLLLTGRGAVVCTSAAYHPHPAFLVVPSPTSAARRVASRARQNHNDPRSLPAGALHANPNSSNNDKKPPSSSSSSSKLPLTASQQERREEEKRRRERSNDVVIGKTSAKTNAKDYPIDPKSTEELYLRQASNIEQEIYKQTEKGMEYLKTLQLEKASASFDRVFALKPNAYLWQAGIARFYQNELQQAADIFARNAATFESKFGEPASEERIWRDACQLKVYSSMDKKKRKEISSSSSRMEDAAMLVAQVPERKDNDEGMPLSTSTESRKVLRITKELFEASIERDAVKEVLARAKLRAIAGSVDEQPQVDRKMWKLNAWYYLGLHYDVIGEETESKECMKMALRLCPSSNGNDIIHTLPMLHMARREWFDDEEFDDGEEKSAMDKRGGGNGQSSKNKSTRSTISVMDRGTRSDPVVVESIRNSVSKMKYTQLQNALKTRGLKFHASKEELATKLFNSLLEDTGLD